MCVRGCGCGCSCVCVCVRTGEKVASVAPGCVCVRVCVCWGSLQGPECLLFTEARFDTEYVMLGSCTPVQDQWKDAFCACSGYHK